MHELPLTQSILALALDTAAANSARRINGINLVIGELSSIVDDSVQFYFDILSKNTSAEGARLRFQRVPGQGVCLDCHHEFPVRPPLAPVCPACGSTQLRVAGGKEFYIDSIDIDD